MPNDLAGWLGLGSVLIVAIINAIISYVNNQHLAVIKTQTNNLTTTAIATATVAAFQAGAVASAKDPVAALTLAGAAVKDPNVELPISKINPEPKA